MFPANGKFAEASLYLVASGCLCPGDPATRLRAEHYGSPHNSEGINLIVSVLPQQSALCAQILERAELGT
jgi:hypothetical protein